jgi:hypothetical protein
MRTVVVGDVHGCSSELETLLERVSFAPDDRLVMVGDLVARGPDSRGVLAAVRGAGGRSVLGNHEAKLLAWRDRGAPLRPMHLEVAESLSDEDWAMLRAMPLWIDLPGSGARVVHAGVLPGCAIEETPPEALLTMRTIDGEGRWSDSREGVLWGARYEGPDHVLFGHHAREDMQVWPFATGLDTACVYGGRLTAMVLEDGEVPGSGGSQHGPHGRTVSIKARRRYYGA